MNEYVKTETIVENQSTITVSEYDAVNFVTSRDGTLIGYRQIGHGPGVVMLHDAMESARSHTRLAEALGTTEQPLDSGGPDKKASTEE